MSASNRPRSRSGMKSNHSIFRRAKAARGTQRRRLAIEQLESRHLLSVYTVTVSGDTMEPGNPTAPVPVEGTLRYGIDEVNQGFFDTIEFAVSTVDVTRGPLPAITQQCTIDGGTAGVTINGTKAAKGADGLSISASSCTVENVGIFGFSVAQIYVGGSGNTVNNCYVGTAYKGTSQGSKATCYGIDVTGSGNTIEANVISGCTGYAALYVLGSGATGNTIMNNFIGTDMTGTKPIPNSESGIIVQLGANNNQFSGNVISANEIDGIDIGGAGTSNNVLQGNFIGTNLGGTAGTSTSLHNGRYGVDIYGGATNNIIGGYLGSVGDASEEGGNVISNNGTCGVMITDTDAHVTSGNYVEGNCIGTDITGSNALPNGEYGVAITDGAAGNYIGAVAPDSGERYGNVISCNGQYGILIGICPTLPKASPAHGNFVQANLIGTDPGGGDTTLGNGRDGVYINGGYNNTIGAVSNGGKPVAGTGAETAPGNLPDPASNVIAGNALNGVQVESGTGNRISLNQIFDNGEMGIDLGSAEAIVGPAATARSGPDNLQNYPVLTSVTDDGQTTIVGTLQPAGGQTSYWIEFYANATLSKGGLSEGQWFLGAQQFTVGADRRVDINCQVSTPDELSTSPTGEVWTT